MKLYKQGFRLEGDAFYVVSGSKGEAQNIFLDSTKEIIEYLSDNMPIETGNIEEVCELTPEEEEELKDVILDSKGLKTTILKEKRLQRLKEII